MLRAFEIHRPNGVSSFFESVRSALLLTAILLTMGGCATTRSISLALTLERQDGNAKMVLMPLDVELSVLTAGGILEPRADWTEAAKKHILAAVKTELQGRGATLLLYQEPEDSDPLHQRLAEIERLHGVVGQAIVRHKYTGGLELPTKKGIFDWSLGPEVKTLRQKHDADYALFIRVRDSYNSAGRILVTLAVAVLGTGLNMAQQLGFTSLVDLRNGDIVWFNHLLSSTGDLRTEEPATETVSLLLKGLPR